MSQPSVDTADPDDRATAGHSAASSQAESESDEGRAADDLAGTPPRRRIPRPLRHEWTLVALASVVLATVMTWPAVRDPLHTLPGDIWDPSLLSWVMAWNGWAVLHDPGQLWQTNAFHGERLALAYSDNLLGYLPASLIGSGPQAAVLRFNIIFESAFALAFFGAYMLARQLGSGVAGALVAGASFAYAPWRYTQYFHLQVLSTGGIALSLAMLARGHGYSMRHGYRPERSRPGWALAGWLVATWQVSLGFGIGLPFGYVLAGITAIVVVAWLIRRPSFSRRLLRYDAIGLLVFAVVSGALAAPYLRVVEIYPYARRQLVDVLFYSPNVIGFFIAPSGEWLWGGRTWMLNMRFSKSAVGGWEALLLPGYFVMALALLGMVLSAWSWRRRVLLLAAMVGFGFLAMGMRAPITKFYTVMFNHLPGWNAIRVPGRLVIWVSLILALLAAAAVTGAGERLGRRIRGRRPGTRRLVLVIAAAVPLSLVLLEGVQNVGVAAVPPAPQALDASPGPLLVLPSDWMDDEVTQLWSTRTFPTIVNGSSGFEPLGLTELRKVTLAFPDPTSVAYLRKRGVRTVVVLRHPPVADFPQKPDGWVLPTHALTASVDGLGIRRTPELDTVVFDLDQA